MLGRETCHGSQVVADSNSPNSEWPCAFSSARRQCVGTNALISVLPKGSSPVVQPIEMRTRSSRQTTVPVSQDLEDSEIRDILVADHEL